MGRNSVIFFNNLEQTMKSYRQFVQKNLISGGIGITFDQWQVLQSLSDNPSMTQREIAAMVSKDTASLTRILQLLVSRGYLEKRPHSDKRKTSLHITPAGKEEMKKARHIINEYRELALNGIEEKRLKKLRKILTKISENCA